MSTFASGLTNQINKIVARQINYRVRPSRIVSVYSSVGPVLNDAGLMLPPDTFYISKSIDLNSLKPGDLLLMVETKNDMPVVTDLIRSVDDDSDSFDLVGDLGVSGELVVQDTLHAENGIRIKTFTDKVPPVGPDPSDEDFADPPVGTLALDLRGNAPKLWVRTVVVDDSNPDAPVRTVEWKVI